MKLIMTRLVQCSRIFISLEVDRERNLYGIQNVLPSLLLKFCQGCRVHGGLRLMKRAVRHSIYRYEPDFRDADFKLGRYKGKLCMQLTKDVAASYHRKGNKKLIGQALYLRVMISYALSALVLLGQVLRSLVLFLTQLLLLRMTN